MSQTVGSGSVRVILIDDDFEFLHSAKECLNRMGNFQIDVTSSVEQAEVLIEKKFYDVIVCDIQMPGLSGFDFLKGLRDSKNLIPFIVFTNTDDSQTALEAFRLGANGFVGKWGKPEIVFTTLKNCINKTLKVFAEKNDSLEMI